MKATTDEENTALANETGERHVGLLSVIYLSIIQTFPFHIFQEKLFLDAFAMFLRTSLPMHLAYMGVLAGYFLVFFMFLV